MSEVAAVITSVIGALGVAGGAVKWLWVKIEKRFQQVEDKLAACERREVRQKETTAKHLIVIELLWQVARKSRGATDVLGRCEKLLDDLKQDQETKR